MKFIALISGGKDSTFAIHECQRQGHELIALANLYPLDEHETADAAGDLDSWCFQTVGHGLVAAYARCVPRGVPLYRRATRGSARRKGLSYPPSRATPGDEVEDLAALLAFIVEKHRAAEKEQNPASTPAPPLGVCSGAVASDYQRLRVEAVACGRLGLVSLAPLWRRAQYPLLRAMDREGVRAVIAKVAAAGLDPRRDLGKDVACVATRRRLAALRETYGLNVCGEGGEYETLTLDAPLGVFPRGKVVLGGGGAEGQGDDDDDDDDEETRRRGWRLVITSEDAVAPGGALVPVSFRVVPRDGGDQGQPEGEVVAVPAGYEAPAPPAVAAAAAAGAGDDSDNPDNLHPQVSIHASERHAVVGCRVMLSEPAEQQEQPATTSPETTARAVRAALRAVERAATALLQERGVADRGGPSPPAVWPRALFVHLLLRDMKHFAAANAAYCSVVPLLRPPARACVEAPLPARCLLHVDALLLLPPPSADQQQGQNEHYDENEDDDGAGGEAAQARLGRRVLHVQSVSPWAPACIGPYGQAAADGFGGLLHLAGQIPLDPASMEMLGPAAEEAAGDGDGAPSSSSSSVTVLKHTDRVLRSCQAVAVAAGGRMDGRGCVGAAVYLSPEGGESAGTAAAAVAAFLREGRTGLAAGVEEEDDGEDEDDDDDGYVDEYLRPLEVPRGRVRVDQASWVVGGGGGGGGGPLAGDTADEASASSAPAPPCVYAVVPCLPRGALVEVQPTLLDLRAFAPGGGAGEPPSSSSSSSSEEEEDDKGDEAAAPAPAPAGLPADVAALAASTGATAHLRAYSWLSTAAPGGKKLPPQKRLAARLLVALPPLESCESADLPRAAAAAVATALHEARPLLSCAVSINVASLRAWCTPQAYDELAGSEGEESSPLDAALALVPLGGGGGPTAGVQLLPALEVRCSSSGDAEGGSGLSAPCAAVVELVVLH